MSTAAYTSTFYLNRHSRENAQSQWVRHLQSNAYIRTLGDVVERNRVGLERTINAASTEQKEALQRVCQSVEDGFAHVSKHLQEINFSISELRGEISEMASMLDWRLSELIEEQRVTNQLLGRVAQLLRIPDSQKQRVYHIEQGLKYLKNAIIEADVDSTFYDDALEELTRAETIERKDYITLGRLGHVYLYSRRHMNIPLAEQYYLKAAREALAESNAGGTTTAVHLSPRGHEPQVYARDPFRAAAAEAYLYAGRASYLQNKLPDAANLAGRAYDLVPEFTEAGYEQAKYLSANGRENDASRLLLRVIEQDRYFSLKTLADPDLAERAAVIEMLGQLQARTLGKAQEAYQRCATQAGRDSRAGSALSAIKGLIAKRDLLDCLAALDQLAATYQLPYYEYLQNGEVVQRRTASPPLSLPAFLEKENESRELLERLRRQAQAAIVSRHTWTGGIIGAVVGFVAGIVLAFQGGCGAFLGALLAGGVLGALLGASTGAAAEPKIQDGGYWYG